MKTTIKVDMTQFNKFGAKIIKQVDYATARALTETAVSVAKMETELIKKSIDRPTPFTQRAIGWTRATPLTKMAEVYVRAKQAEYLRLLITGGAENSRHPAPATWAKDQYGNLPRGYLKRKGLGLFTIEVGGQLKTLIRQRGSKAKLVAVGTTSRSYSKIFPFYEEGERAARKEFDKQFPWQLAKAIATSR